jgi:hypothetical protein
MQLSGVLAFQSFESESAQIVDLDVAASGAEKDHVLGCSSTPSGSPLAALRTLSFDFSRMQSSRRMTTKGRMTLPYSDCLKSPRRISAMLQTNDAGEGTFELTCLSFQRVSERDLPVSVEFLLCIFRLSRTTHARETFFSLAISSRISYTLGGKPIEARTKGMSLAFAALRSLLLCLMMSACLEWASPHYTTAVNPQVARSFSRLFFPWLPIRHQVHSGAKSKPVHGPPRCGGAASRTAQTKALR